MRLVTCGCLLVSSVALAQAPDDVPPAAPITQPPPPAPGAPAVMPAAYPMTVAPPIENPHPYTDRGTLEDANAGRVAVMSTALTPPAGTWAFEDWELFFLGVSYSPTDQLIITANTMIPISSDFEWGYISAKYQLLRSGPVRLAAQAGIAGVWAKGSNSSDSTSGLEVGGVATFCFNDDCSSHGSISATTGFAHQDSNSWPFVFSGGIVAKLTTHVRFIAEADTAAIVGDISDHADGFLGWYGFRFTSKNIGVDLTLVKPFCGSDCNSDVLPLGFPFVTFTYRGLD